MLKFASTRRRNLVVVYALVAAAEGLPAALLLPVRTLSLTRPIGAVSTLGVLASSAAAASLLGGWLARRSPSAVVRRGLALAGVGSWGWATGTGFDEAWALVVGAGVGLVQPGVLALGCVEVRPGRQGREVGLYGAAASVGLGAAGLAGAFFAGAVEVGLVGLGALLLVSVLAVRSPPSASFRESTARVRLPWNAWSLALTAGALRYGVVASLPILAVTQWGTTRRIAALLLLAGVGAAVPCKLIITAATDRFPANRVVQTCAFAVLICGGAVFESTTALTGTSGAVVFIGLVAALLSLANLQALRLDAIDPLQLGVVRCAQLGGGAATLMLSSLVVGEDARVWVYVLLSSPLLVSGFLPSLRRWSSADGR
ncbi:MAG: hypothetical protein ACRBN8_19385 [Nannocystales bacterium]